jgi:hypothetical protein
LDGIKTYLDEATDNSVLIPVAGEVPGSQDPSLTWQNLLLEIQKAGVNGKSVELDLSGSTLALFNRSSGEKKFDYKDDGEGYGTGEPCIKKLILSRSATSITNGLTVNIFSSLDAASGLNVIDIPNNAFYSQSLV